MKKKSDIVIIGAGMGGLFCGALLAKNGYRVTLLEKSYQYGGGLQNFSRHGENFETGMHVAAGFNPGGTLFRICTYLGIMDQLSITETGMMMSAMFANEQVRIDIPKGRQGFIKALSDAFPQEHDNIERYVTAIERISHEETMFWMETPQAQADAHSDEFFMPASSMIESYTGNRKLQQVLAIMNPLYAGVEGHTPAYLHAMVSVLFMDTPSYFVGGSMELAKALAGVIEKAGGEILTNIHVTQLKSENCSITGVTDASGNEYCANWYISDINPCTLADMISGKGFTPGFVARIKDIPASTSAFKVFVKLRKDSLAYENYPVCVVRSMDRVWNAPVEPGSQWPGMVNCFMVPQADGKYASHLTIMALMDWESVSRWEDTSTGKRGKEYQEWKDSMTSRVMELLNNRFPGLDGMVEYSFAASPLTFRDWTGTPKGAIYGYARDCNDLIGSRLSVRTRIKNLLLTGQCVNMHGIGGVPLTALETAGMIVGNNQIMNEIIRQKI